MSTCKFCEMSIPKSRVTAHYRVAHKHDDLFANQAFRWVNRHNGDIIREYPIQRRRIRSRRRHGRNIVIHQIIERKHEPEPLEQVYSCIMCLNDHYDKILPCNHENSCARCLSRWWKESFYSPRCPICRTTVESVVRNGIKLDIVTEWFKWRQQLLNQRGDERIPSLM